MKLFEFKCLKCNTIFEEIVNSDTELPRCTSCGSHTKRIVSAVKGWVKSKERTALQLKQRSQNHMRMCKEKGIPLDTNMSGISSDPVWRNKIRAKNTSPSTIQQYQSVSNNWQETTAGTSPVANMPYGSFAPTIPGDPKEIGDTLKCYNKNRKTYTKER